MISIVLADDHQIVRRGLRVLLEAETDFCIVGEAANGLEAITLAERLRPSVLVIDIMMPDLNGLEATRHIKDRLPETRVVVLSMHTNEAYVFQALKNGAEGYVLKDSSETDIVQAVREVLAGRRYLSPQLSQQAIAVYIEKAPNSEISSYDALTTRERGVLQLAAQGYTSRQIANRLCLSPRTVETHRTNLIRKLGLKTQTDLIRYALRHGIIPTDI